MKSLCTKKSHLFFAFKAARREFSAIFLLALHHIFTRKKPFSCCASLEILRTQSLRSFLLCITSPSGETGRVSQPSTEQRVICLRIEGRFLTARTVKERAHSIEQSKCVKKNRHSAAPFGKDAVASPSQQV